MIINWAIQEHSGTKVYEIRQCHSVRYSNTSEEDNSVSVDAESHILRVMTAQYKKEVLELKGIDTVHAAIREVRHVVRNTALSDYVVSILQEIIDTNKKGDMPIELQYSKKLYRELNYE